MTQSNLAAVILAAGKGTRMKSEIPKVLHPMAGHPLAYYPVELAKSVGCSHTVMVIGHGAQQVEDSFSGSGVRFALQVEQQGTGQALLCARDALNGFEGTLLLLCGDVPLLRQETIQRLLSYHDSEKAAVTVLTVEMPDPFGYGRIIRDGEEVLRIVEEKDATLKEKAVREINSGIYAFAAPLVFEFLSQVGNDNAQGEYYLTDVLSLARQAGRPVRALKARDPEEIMGINDRVQLAQASAIMRQRINEEFMRRGVTLIDPMTTYIDPQVRIGTDTMIYPGAQIQGNSEIGCHCIIDSGVTISNCRLGDHVHIKAGSVLSDSEVGAHSDVGPMAHLRPGTVLAGNNKIGNFVETKKAQIGSGSKASHLTYIGDAELGRNVNVGCGTITCNYDGVKKHRTVIEDDVFVGSDVQFVAPVHIGRNSLIGAGSTITKNVPPDSLAISRTEQKNIDGWRLRKKKQD